VVVIGVHTPEFTVEHGAGNVRRAVTDRRLEHPVALDDEYAVWRAFGNRYWPALYLIDAQGRIRHHQFGEGGYERTELVLQELLAQSGAGAGGRGLVSVTGQGVEAPADWLDLRSPEKYLGHGRTQDFAAPGGVVPGARSRYALPARLRPDHWALSGEWTVGEEATVLHEAHGRIACRFHARDLHLVMGPGDGGDPVRFRVLVDGEPPGAAHGIDVDGEGRGTVTEPRLHQLVRQPGPITDRQVEIEFLDPGVQALVFTFG
jgi:hypothetical protein